MPLPQPTPLETVLLQDGDSVVYLAPERGGMATRFFVGAHPVFYLDEATLLDRTKNVRGGNPVLFPSPGKLAGDRFEREGRSGAMGQHGFARTSAWEVVERAPASATLRLAASDATRAVFPWDFVATYRYVLRGPALRIEQRIEAKDEPVPFGLGFHPYFHVEQSAKPHARVGATATRAWDNAKKAEVALAGPIDLTAAEVDLHLLDHRSTSLDLEVGDRRTEVRASPELGTWVIWTLAGRDFVCVEPWSCPGDALNTGDKLLVARPGSPVDVWTEIVLY